jgi:cGMP-dependent protein kinase
MTTKEEERLKGLVSNLENELKTKESKNSMLEAEVRSLQRRMLRRDNEILKQERELHKLRSVLQQASTLMAAGEDHLLSSIQGEFGNGTNAKKQGVSGQSLSASSALSIAKHSKDFRSRTVIKEAIMENDFLKNLSAIQVRDLVDAMSEKTVPKGCYVIREGENGSHLYVSGEGEYDVIKDGKILGRLGVGKAFGELAILYNCKRTASIKAVTDGKLWALERSAFQKIMMSSGIKKMENQVNFLKSVPLLSTFPTPVLAKISDVLEVEHFKKGDFIVREGTSGDTFYIISEGEVTVTKRNNEKDEEIRKLTKGEYFGEQALLKTDVRTASVVATSDTLDCLTLDRESFFQLVGDLNELRDKTYKDITNGKAEAKDRQVVEVNKEFADVTLDDLEVIATLGVGGFGRVELVKCLKKPSNAFALKCLKKQHIVETQQQEHVYSEKNILLSCKHNFITRLYKTFKDKKYIYMLMEVSLGGELWTILRDRGWFEDSTTRFYIACVVSAFDYLHSHGIIYRDLKPENLLLDKEGYIKMVDFGFSKNVDGGRKTWTFCGTPEYVAPEIILNKGHDRAVDFWSLGILMYELLAGTPPFTASDPMKVYNIILRGFDQIEPPRHINRTAVTLMKRFCRENPSERIGYQKDGINDIKKHRWFQGFDWEGLESRSLTPPIKPAVKGPSDASNFDKYPRDEAVPQDETSGWDKDF